MSWIPPKSPYILLQELYVPDEWRVLVCCLLLNQTSRKQVDPMINELFERYPDAKAMTTAKEEVLHGLLKPLGLWKRRTITLKRFSQEFLNGGWNTAKDLYGCGKYADDAWRIFCKGDWWDVEPSDHALNEYHDWIVGEVA
jgi:methyl-CpG-binding domain protein 4